MGEFCKSEFCDGRCNKRRWRSVLDDADYPALRTLTANLAVAGALCEAWKVGFQGGVMLHTAHVHKYWRPGHATTTPEGPAGNE